MKLFDSVPRMMEEKIRSMTGEWILDTERCAVLAASCKWLDIFAEENEIGEEDMTAEFAGDSSVVLIVRSCGFIIDRGRSDPLYLAMCGADDIVFAFVDEDTVVMDLRFDGLLTQEKMKGEEVE